MRNNQPYPLAGRALLGLSVLVFCFSILVFLKQVMMISQAPFEDFPIFYSAVQQYVESGVLYTRQLDYYYPASGIYKFPALYGSFLLPLVKNHISLEAAQTGLLCLHIVLYITSIVMLVYLLMPGKHRVLFGLWAGILGLNLYPLQETLRTLQLEMYILFLTTLMLALLNRQRYFWSGTVLAFMSLLKLYPVFVGIFFLWKRKATFFAGFALTSLLLLAWMISCFGLAENQWYFFSALPVMLQEGAFINHHNIGIEKLINHTFATSHFIHYQTVLGVGSAAMTKVILGLFFVVGLFAFFRQQNLCGARDDRPHYMAVSLLLTLALLTLKNPWSNYQIVLMIPLLYILSRLLVLPRNKIPGGLFCLTCLLLCLSPTNKSLFFTTFAGSANPLLMFVLTVLNDKLFAYRGGATILVYIMLILLLLRKEPLAHE